MIINYSNHALNLILYILISSTFRKEFKEFFIAIGSKVPLLGKNKASNETKRTNNYISYEEAVKLNKVNRSCPKPILAVQQELIPKPEMEICQMEI